MLQFADDKGRVKLSDIVTYFREFYEARRAAGLVAEKANSIFAKGSYTDAQAQRNILSNPFKRFEDMQMLHHTKTLGVIQVDESVWKKLTREENRRSSGCAMRNWKTTIGGSDPGQRDNLCWEGARWRAKSI